MGEQVRRIADSVWLMMAARIVSIIGVPVAAMIAGELWGTVKETNRMIYAMREQVIEMTAERKAIVWRLEQVESAIHEIRRRGG